MIILPLLWQVPKAFHQKFLSPALRHYHVDLDLSVSTCCALKHFFCLNPVPNVCSTTPVEVLLELLLFTRYPSLLVLKIYGEPNFLKMLTDVIIYEQFSFKRLIPPTLINFRNPESLFSTVPGNL